jgi:hypothetical protein|tara:strand:+ start:4606 stop:5145 length:540 start_codon:yes stop_codon:yes gene_type:complete
MAYPKINVNTGLALEVIASDTILIPSPGLPTLTGAATSTTTNKLVDSNAKFVTNKVQIGDIVYNTTDNTVVTVTAIDSETTLTVSANLFADTETYKVFVGGPVFSTSINSSSGCLLYVGTSDTTMDFAKSFVDIKVKTVAGNDVQFRNFPVGQHLPVQVLQLFDAGTDASAGVSCVAIW